MKYSKESFVAELVGWVREQFEEKRFGTFGVEITIHEGMPVSVTKSERLTFNRIVGGIESK
ncbi:MAG: hypothetical protein JW724_04035 [Candidatus Altiarchaeota archaeon]|nr:hypothetical protein [Candidatus Altiarchaeota archaeon]